MRVREVLADVADVDQAAAAGVIVVVDPGGDQALPGDLEVRVHEDGAAGVNVLGNREYPQLAESRRALDRLGFLGGMRAWRITGPPRGSVPEVGVHPLAEFTAPPRGGIPVEDPQHVPGFGGPGAERVVIIELKRVLLVPGEDDAGQHVLIEPLEQLGERHRRLRGRRGGAGLIDAAGPGDDAAQPVELQLRLQQLGLRLGVVELLVFQPGAEQVTIVFYIVEPVLEAASRRDISRWPRSTPRPSASSSRKRAVMSSGPSRKSAAEAPDWNSLTRLVSSSPAMATSRTAVVVACPAGARPAASSPGLRAKGPGGTAWMARRMVSGSSLDSSRSTWATGAGSGRFSARLRCARPSRCASLPGACSAMVLASRTRCRLASTVLAGSTSGRKVRTAPSGTECDGANAWSS